MLHHVSVHIPCISLDVHAYSLYYSESETEIHDNMEYAFKALTHVVRQLCSWETGGKQ